MTETIVQLDFTKVSADHTVGVDGRSLFNQDGGYHNLGTPAAVGTDFGTDDFTVEGWFNVLELDSTDQSILGNFSSTDTGSWGLFVTDTPNPRIQFEVVGGVLATAAVTIQERVWYHVAVSRTDGTLRVFLNGVLDLKVTATGAIGGTGDLIVGGNQSGSRDQFHGWIDELRVTKGVSRYPSDDSFTVPTTPYPRPIENIFIRDADAGGLTLTGHPVNLTVPQSFDLAAGVGSSVIAGQAVELTVNTGLSLTAEATAGGVSDDYATISWGTAAPPAQNNQYWDIAHDGVVTRVQVVAITITEVFGNDPMFFWVVTPKTADWSEQAVSATRALVADTTTTTFAGQPLAVRAERTLTAESGAIGAEGQTAATVVERVLPANNQIMLVEGRQAALTTATEFDLLAVRGSVVASGEAATLQAGRVLTASAGDSSLAPSDTPVLRGRRVEAGTHVATMTGQIADLVQLTFREIDAAVGAVATTGQDAGLRASRSLTAEAGAVQSTGQDVIAVRPLFVDVGQLIVAGQDAQTLVARTLSAAPANFVLTGQQAAASTSVEFSLLASRATMLSIGQTVTVQVGRRLKAGAGSLTITGQPSAAAGSVAAVELIASVGSVSVTGQSAPVVIGASVDDPYWNNVCFLVGFDTDPVIDEGPRRIDLTEFGAPTRTVPAVGGAGGAYNQTSTTDYRNWVTADRLLDGTIPGKFYWEFACNAGGPAQFNGYHGVVSRNQLDDPNQTYDSDNNPIRFGSLVYRGTGQIIGNSTTVVTGPAAYGAGDVVMIAFEPSTGKFWVGLNGVWHDDPTTDPPTRTSDDAGGDFWPVLQAREPGEGGTLRSVTSQFSYAVPTGFSDLGSSIQMDLTQVSKNHTISVDGRSISNQSGGLHRVGTAFFIGSQFGVEDFTLEGWFFALEVDAASPKAIIGNFSHTNPGSWTFLVSGVPNLRFVVSGGSDVLAPTALSSNTWYHFAVSRTAGVLRIFLDGALELKDTDNFTGDIGGNNSVFLGWDGLSVASKFPGWLDEVRCTNGVSRYPTDGSFAVPTTPYPRPTTFTFELEVDAGDLTITGQIAQVRSARRLSADTGSVTAGGRSAGVVAERQLVAAAQPVAAVGQPVALTTGNDVVLLASASGISATGAAPSLRVGRTLPATAGGLSLTASVTPVVADRQIVAEADDFSITGPATPVQASRVLTADAGSVTATGEAPVVSATRMLGAERGILTLTGLATEILENLFVTVGALSVAGQATLVAARHIAAGVASLASTGAVVGVATRRTLTAAHGAIAFTVPTTLMRAARTAPVAAGDLVSIGQSVELARRRAIIAGAGDHILASPAVPTLLQRRVGVNAGMFALTSPSVPLLATTLMPAAPGSYIVAGHSSESQLARVIGAPASGIELAGLSPSLHITQIIISRRRRAILTQSPPGLDGGQPVGGAVPRTLVRGSVTNSRVGGRIVRDG